MLGRQDSRCEDAFESESQSVAHFGSGYFVMRNSQDAYMIADCGRVCPDYLPPHGHSDTLSYELSLKEQDFIVDSGIFEYTSGKWRDFFRSTRAHNTLVVDGEDQSEAWGSFRIARRAFPVEVRWISEADVDYFSGIHDGYNRLKVPAIHCRRILFIKEGLWCILDQLTGKGLHRAESLIHFHPDIDLQKREGHFVSSAGGQILSVLPFAYQEIVHYHGEEEILQGWYSPEFGVKIPNSVIGLKKEGQSSLLYGYMLVVGTVEDWNIDYDLQATEEIYYIRLDGKQYRVIVDLGSEHIHLVS
jgi:hypothetical protein